MKQIYNKARLFSYTLGIAVILFYALSKGYANFNILDSQNNISSGYINQVNTTKIDQDLIDNYNKMDKPIIIKDSGLILLDVNDINNDLIIKSSGYSNNIAILSLLKDDNSMNFHIIDTVKLENVKLSDFIKSFFKIKSEEDGITITPSVLYIIKDLYIKYPRSTKENSNNDLYQNLHFKNIIVEVNPKGGIILLTNVNNNHNFKAIFNTKKSNLGYLSKITPEEKEILKSKLLRKYLKLR